MLKICEIDKFLVDYPGMSIVPVRKSLVRLSGDFEFTGFLKDNPRIVDSYQLKIDIPNNFPNSLPEVIEIGGRIPRDGKHHVNYDNTLCLGSPIRIRLAFSKHRNLIGFARNILVPYLIWTGRKPGSTRKFMSRKEQLKRLFPWCWKPPRPM